MIWLGEKSGYLSDWVTQQWVRVTGRRISLASHPWLDGPVGKTKVIGRDFFADHASEKGLELVEDGPCGLIRSFNAMAGIRNDPRTIASEVKEFYERTSDYELDAWAEWHGLFKPFGKALAIIFSRRLQQLNLPLSPLDSSHGMSSRVLQMWDRKNDELVQTGWVRELHATRNVLYAGAYSICTVPGYKDPCVKVVFPLPNGNAIVLMQPTSQPDGSLSLSSAGHQFGDPGFYLVVHGPEGTAWARHVKAMTERITVYAAEQNSSRAEHVLWFFGKEFLRLHYRMRMRVDAMAAN